MRSYENYSSTDTAGDEARPTNARRNGFVTEIPRLDMGSAAEASGFGLQSSLGYGFDSDRPLITLDDPIGQ